MSSFWDSVARALSLAAPNNTESRRRGPRFAEVPVVALEAVDGAGVFGRAYDTVRLWFAKS